MHSNAAAVRVTVFVKRVEYGIKLALLSENGSVVLLSNVGADAGLPNRTRAGFCPRVMS